MIKTALFDLDGTLIDTEGQYSEFWGAIGREFVSDRPTFSQDIKGRTLTQIFSMFFASDEVRREVTLRLDRWESQMDYGYIDGARDFLEHLRERNINIGIVTSSNNKKMESLLRKRPEISRLADRILTAEMFAASKPAPDCYLLGAKVFGSAIDECVCFEDALTGLQAGRSAGMFTVGLATTLPRHEVEKNADMVIGDYRGLSIDTIALSASAQSSR